MSWQAEVFAAMRDRRWHHLGRLFEQFEQQIPLHHATRYVMHPARGHSELPINGQARWLYFLSVLATISVETDGAAHSRQWNDRVRLRHVANRACPDCGGPVIKQTWTARTRFTCLACEQAKRPAIVTEAPRPSSDAPPMLPAPPLPPPSSLAPRWVYRARRSLARFLKWRLPTWSANRIEKKLQQDGYNPDRMLQRIGQRPLTNDEWSAWWKPYFAAHPPYEAAREKPP
jgi:hypothetical protein